MAKRKRLIPTANPPVEASSAGLETKGHPFGVAPPAPTRAPIAQVAGDAASQAALDELVDEINASKAEGRLVQALPLDVIEADHLVRDRLSETADDAENLKASLRARGQQTPIEVVDLGAGRFGLISGWRRLAACKALAQDDAQFARIKALIKPIDSVSDSYVAMVEENEIRANLSFYERAYLASEAARLGVYPTPARAVQILFANVTSAKRSKINSFVKLHDHIGADLRFPAAIPEKLGLALVNALDRDKTQVRRIKSLLKAAAPQSIEQERAMLEDALRIAPKSAAAPSLPPSQPAVEVAPGIMMQSKAGRIVLTGQGVTQEMQDALIAWLAQR